MAAPEKKLIDDYWMSLVRSALIDVLKQDAVQDGNGALPTRALDFLLDHNNGELDAVMLRSEDARVRESWGEFVRLISLSARITLLMAVKTVLSNLPDRLIPYAEITQVINELQFA